MYTFFFTITEPIRDLVCILCLGFLIECFGFREIAGVRALRSPVAPACGAGAAGGRGGACGGVGVARDAEAVARHGRGPADGRDARPRAGDLFKLHFGPFDRPELLAAEILERVRAASFSRSTFTERASHRT